jgi:hypothetical protein
MTLSACSTSPIKTETVTVYKPEYVSLPESLVQPVAPPDMVVNTNSDLSNLLVAFKKALAQANRQLEAIRAAQP